MTAKSDSEEKRLFPPRVYLQIRDACNGRCVFCPRKGLEGQFKRGAMSDALLEKILEEVDGHRDQVIEVGINFRCEPSLDRRLVDWCRRLSGFGYPPKVTTNGSFIHNHDLAELVRHASVIHFSMHGGPDAENRERYMPGFDHEQCYRNFREVGDTIKRLGAETQLWASDMFCHADKVETMQNRWADMAGCDTFVFMKTVPFQRTDAVDSGVRFGSRVICRSYGPHILGGILWDGTMIICAEDWKREYSPGRIHEDGTIEELFTNDAASRFRDEASGLEDLPEGHICRRCYTAKELS